MRIEFIEETHQYFVDGEEYPSATTILEPLTAKHYGAINPSVLDMARRRGSAVHAVTEAIDLGLDLDQCEDMTPEILPHIKAYKDFLRDWRPQWYGIEYKVAGSSPNIGVRYAGTVDRWGKLGSKWAVFDIKTTSAPTRENHMALCCQTIAYANALAQMGETSRTEAAQRYGVYLKSDGSYRVFDCQKWEEKNRFDPANTFVLCERLYRLTHGGADE